MANLGHPFVDIYPDGKAIFSKVAETGGILNLATVKEQLLYEVMNPQQYFTPDVVADFTSVHLKETARDVVAVTGGTANGITDTYKVSISYRDGFASAGTLVLAGPDAIGKARRSGAVLLERLRHAGVTFAASNVEVLGGGDCVPGVVKTTHDPPEVVLRVAVRDPRRSAVERFTKEFAPLVTAGFAGTTGYTTGRPPVREVFAYWPALIAKSAVIPSVTVV
jgi:hypothetical protein